MEEQHIYKINSNNSFIDSIHNCNLPLSYLKSYLVYFSSQFYSDDLYTVYDIPFPEKLKKSTRKRKSEFIAGRVAAKLALTQLHSKSLFVLYDNNRCPIFPNNTIGSISHTDKVAIAIAAPCHIGRSIGVDIEKIFSEESLIVTKKCVFKDEELDILLKIDLSEKTAATILFSAKESIFKAIFSMSKKHIDFDYARLIWANHAESKLLFCLGAKTSSIDYFIEVFYSITKNYIISYTIF